MPATSLNPGPIFQHVGLTRQFPSGHQPRSDDEDSIPDSPLAGYYDEGNCSTSLILLNNRMRNKAGSKLRYHSVDSKQPRKPNVRRHSPDNYPHKNPARHEPCLDSSSPVFQHYPAEMSAKSPSRCSSRNSSGGREKRGKPRKHAWTDESGKSDNRHPSNSRASTATTRRSGDPDTGRRRSGSPRRSRSRYTISVQDYQYLAHPSLSYGNRAYLWHTAQAYDVQRMKTLKMLQYQQILWRQRALGFHPMDQYQRYKLYLQGPRTGEYDLAQPASQRSKSRQEGSAGKEKHEKGKEPSTSGREKDAEKQEKEKSKKKSEEAENEEDKVNENEDKQQEEDEVNSSEKKPSPKKEKRPKTAPPASRARDKSPKTGKASSKDKRPKTASGKSGRGKSSRGKDKQGTSPYTQTLQRSNRSSSTGKPGKHKAKKGESEKKTNQADRPPGRRSFYHDPLPPEDAGGKRGSFLEEVMKGESGSDVDDYSDNDWEADESTGEGDKASDTDSHADSYSGQRDEHKDKDKSSTDDDEDDFLAKWSRDNEEGPRSDDDRARDSDTERRRQEPPARPMTSMQRRRSRDSFSSDSEHSQQSSWTTEGSQDSMKKSKERSGLRPKSRYGVRPEKSQGRADSSLQVEDFDEINNNLTPRSASPENQGDQTRNDPPTITVTQDGDKEAESDSDRELTQSSKSDDDDDEPVGMPATDDMFAFLSREGSVLRNWKFLVIRLGLTSGDVTAVEADHIDAQPHEMVFEAFTRWRMLYGRKATREKLAQALRNEQLHWTADKLLEIFPSEPD